MELFIDTNIFLFLLKKQEGWEKIAEIIDSPKNKLHTSCGVLNELKYKLLWLAAAERLNANDKYAILNEIKNNLELRKGIFKKYIEFYGAVCAKVKVHDVLERDEIISCALSVNHGLLPTDAAIVAIMLRENIKNIFTEDKDFDNIKEIKRIGLT